MSIRRALLVLGALTLTTGCSRTPHAKSDAGGGDSTDGPCTEGDRRCAGSDSLVCHGGAYVTETTCSSDQVCADGLGCAACKPGHNACDGDRIVNCGDDGKPGGMPVSDCSPLTCAIDPMSGDPACVEPCDPKALARSYTGCVYYAVDLPQWSIPGPLITTVASDQDFAIAVANPWPVPVDVLVERDDAPPGMPPQTSQVLKKQVPGGGLVVMPLPQREVSGYVKGQKRNRTLLTANAYRVTTSRPASVYQFNPVNNPNAFSNDASLLIPANALDWSYVALGFPGRGGDVTFGGLTVQTDNRPYLTIVATRPNTRVRVTPSTPTMPGDNVPAMQKGKSYTFTLGEFDTLNIEGADTGLMGSSDLTGTRIEANGPLAVWSGVECITANPPNAMMTCCCDHLEEQLFPRSSLGQDYVVVRSEGRSHGSADPEFFRILALDDNTVVKTSLGAPDDQFTLDAGQMHEIDGMDDFIVSASHAVMIGQFQVSQDSSPAGTGDPSFELVPPLAQFRTEYIFSVPNGYMENWVLIAIPAGQDVNLDGKLADCDRSPVGDIGGQSYDALRCQVMAGPHRVDSGQSGAKFGLVVEGWGPGPVSYGYTGGMEFKTVNHDCTNDSDCPNAEFFCSGGACVPIIQ